MLPIVCEKFPVVVRSRIFQFSLLRRVFSTVPITADEKLKGVEKKDSDFLEKIDVEKLPRAQKRFVKEFEKVNNARVDELFKKNYKNIVGLILLLTAVVAIYSYTMYAVKQETILEEIDEEVSNEENDKLQKET